MNTEKEIEQCHHHGLLTEEASGLHPLWEEHGLGIQEVRVES